MACKSSFVFDDLLEAVVVIAGVEACIRGLGLQATAGDALCPTVTGSGGTHGVFAVVATGLTRQYALAVAEDRAVFVAGEGAALRYSCIGGATVWQIGQGNRFTEARDSNTRFGRFARQSR